MSKMIVLNCLNKWSAIFIKYFKVHYHLLITEYTNLDTLPRKSQLIDQIIMSYIFTRIRDIIYHSPSSKFQNSATCKFN